MDILLSIITMAIVLGITLYHRMSLVKSISAGVSASAFSGAVQAREQKIDWSSRGLGRKHDKRFWPSRAVGVVSNLLSKDHKAEFLAKTTAEYDKVREQQARKKPRRGCGV